MRSSAVVLTLLLAGLLIVRWGGSPVPGNAPEVLTITTDAVIARLGPTPGEEEIAAAIVAELSRAASAEPNQDMKEELSNLATDETYVAHLAASARADLAGDAAALAFGNYTVIARPDRVTILSVNIELIPRGFADGLSLAHEDGHAVINDGIARACGERVVRAEVGAGLQGDRLVRAVRQDLFGAGDAAHADYHEAVAGNVFGSHRPAARRAIESVVAAGCLTS